MPSTPSRDELAERYLDQLQFDPYPVQEEALLAWFSAQQGVLVCAPTGMGKTLIAEAALFEALSTRKTAYYTTPLIALTEQKFREMQQRAVDWGFDAGDVGLVTGNRRENPDARVLVVVAEILFNRLLHPEAFDLAEVGVVVMDEFHSFNDPERGIVWEFSLALLPQSVCAFTTTLPYFSISPRVCSTEVITCPSGTLMPVRVNSPFPSNSYSFMNEVLVLSRDILRRQTSIVKQFFP